MSQSRANLIQHTLLLALLLLAGTAVAREVRVGVYENEPKVFADAGGKPAGILIELLREIAAREDWQLEFVPCAWQACLDHLAAGQIDLIPDVAYSDERDRRFDFHQTPALYSWSQLYRRKDVAITSPPDLQGKHILVLQGAIQLTGLQAMLHAFGIHAKVTTANSMEEVFRQVQGGQADVAAANHYFGDIRAHEYDLIETPVVFNPARLFYATAHQRNAELLAAIDRHLVQWRQSGTSPYFSILKRWGGDVRHETVPSNIWSVLQFIALLLLGVMGVALFLRWQVRNRTRQLAESRANLQATLDTLPDMLFEVGLDGRFYDYHAAHGNQTLVPITTFMGKTIAEVMPDDVTQLALAALKEANEHGIARGITYALDMPQGKRWYEIAVARKTSGDETAPHFIVLARDITRRQVAETQLARMTRLYNALSQCNQAIVRCADEAELFPQVCRDVVEFGGMRMAWIGMLDTTSGKVQVVSSFGAGTEYLEGIDISIHSNKPTGCGPTGTALREGHPVWCQDFRHDPGTAPWHERGTQFGWAASAALPLQRKGVVIGTLTLYADIEQAFDEAAQNLLVEMAMDISYALDRFADTRERQQMQNSLRQLSLAVEQSPSSIVITDLDANIVYVNATFTEVTGYALEEVMGRNQRMLNSGKTPRATYDDMWAHLTRGERWDGELINRRKDGSEYIESVRMAPVRDEQGVVRNYLTIKNDITAKKQAEARIHQLAQFDQLTGLPNRALLQDRFRFALSLAQRGSEKLAVLFLDLDHFKNINDTLGHSIGDHLLMEVARRLKAAVREEDTVSRQGGDEFVLVLPDVDAHGAAKVAQKLLQAVAVPFKHEVHELTSTPSIGIALYPDDGTDMETLLQHADAAMYQAKQAGRNNFRFYTQAMQINSARNLRLLNELRQALDRNQLLLHYQPQVAMQDGRVIGAEALLRWQHPELGLVSPAEFIPIAEDSGLIIPIGEWVLRTAALQMKAWLGQGRPGMVIAVNLSAVQFRHSNIVERIAAILEESGLPPQALELELTEAVAMDDPQAAVAVMDALYARGIRMSIDDFGTGYSSLSYLKRFKVSKLKIDQSFVRDIGTDPEDKAIVSAIINMASSLGLRTIAEGVETAEQLAFLRLQDCDEVQGYYFSKPLTAEAFGEFLKR
ncbi:MAG: EAL domain-containing protein [Sideroxyarcus sp.]|nr:EAL domain-containing protein [Sideroxyarcus sp.]